MAKGFIQRVLVRTTGVLLVLALWEGNVYFGIYRLVAPSLPGTFFPSLGAILNAASRTLITSDYQSSLLLTVSRTVIAFAIAAILGLVVALLAARSATFNDLIEYPTEFFRQLPAVAIIPFAIMLFGIYTPMKISVAVFGCFFPILVATREGLGSVDSGLMLTARTYGWAGLRLLFGVMLPSALPHILASFRIALAIALILVIMGEMLVGGDGLGVRLVEYERTFDFQRLYAETLLLGIVGVVLNQILAFLSGRLHFWRENRTWRSKHTESMALAGRSQERM